MNLHYTKSDIETIVDKATNRAWSRLYLCQDWLELQAEVKRLREKMSEDLKIIDELLCNAKGSSAWADMGTGYLGNGGLAARDAMVRLEQAWGAGEMKLCTLGLADYFAMRRDVKVSAGETESEVKDG